LFKNAVLVGFAGVPPNCAVWGKILSAFNGVTKVSFIISEFY